MKVLDLQCGSDHVFEGWFASEEDFQSQLSRGLVQCPLCGDAQVHKRLSAPRLNLGAAAPAAGVSPSTPPNPAAPAPSAQPTPQQFAAWLQQARRLVSASEDVGNRFAEEVRKMHAGDSEERAIRGQATLQETAELIDEGIAVLPLPSLLKEPLQ
jgi:hypothetical protein